MSKYRTAQGKIIDMGAMVTKHEKTRAVGNMNVNARGDAVDSHNRVIKDNTQRVSKNYNKTVTKPAAPTPPVIKTPSAVSVPPKVKAPDLSREEMEFEEMDEDFRKE